MEVRLMRRVGKALWKARVSVQSTRSGQNTTEVRYRCVGCKREIKAKICNGGVPLNVLSWRRRASIRVRCLSISNPDAKCDLESYEHDLPLFCIFCAQWYFNGHFPKTRFVEAQAEIKAILQALPLPVFEEVFNHIGWEPLV